MKTGIIFLLKSYLTELIQNLQDNLIMTTDIVQVQVQEEGTILYMVPP
jgi:hypothetical protein